MTAPFASNQNISDSSIQRVIQHSADDLQYPLLLVYTSASELVHNSFERRLASFSTHRLDIPKELNHR